mgnify:CR=1 FL=1
MSLQVQVVLRDDVDKLGRSGDLVRVRAGYARNFLIPRGLAAAATRGSIAQVEHEKRVAMARAAKVRADADAIRARLEGTVITITMQAGEGERLYGSVTTKDLAEALKKSGHEIDRKKIALDEPLKALGDHPVVIRLGHEISATITVKVVKG